MCGIFGIINFRKRKFNKVLFNTLGVINDSRGGDSCGVFIDGKYEYGINENKFYKSYFQKSELIKHTEECNIAIGHCRKASIGNISEKTAQPVIIKNNEKVEFVLMHNGTIYNYEELANKYIPDIDIKDMTDSQVMAQIFYHAGFSVIEEYNGAAVFFIIDYREKDPIYYIFKGKSKMNSYNLTETDERPIYLVFNNDYFSFSSIGDLFCCLVEGSETLTIKSNTLIQIKNGKLITIKEFDRSKCIQTKEIQNKYSSTFFPNTCNKYSSCGYDDFYDIDDSLNLEEYQSKFSYINYDVNKCAYLLKGKNVHGCYHVDKIGKVGMSNESRLFWFYQGYLMKNKECFDFIEKFRKEYGAKSAEELFNVYPNIVRILSYYPIYNDNGIYRIQETISEDYILNKELSFLFTCFCENFTNGKLSNSIYKYDNITDSFNEYIINSQKEVDFQQILKEVVQ